MNRLMSFTIISLLAAVAVAARVKTETIKTKILELPKVSLEKINYNSGLSVSYALGEITIEQPVILREEIICQQKDKGNLVKVMGEYYQIKYNKPDVIIITKDNMGTVVYAEKISASEKQEATYGKGDCRFWFPGVLTKTFETEKEQFLANLKSDETKIVKSSVSEIVNKALFTGYTDETFRLMYVDDKDGNYKDLSEAFEIANSVYSSYNTNGYSPAVVEPLNKAVSIWQQALTESNLNDRKARINYDITIKTYENLAVAYMYLNDYENAILYFNKIKAIEKSITSTNIPSHFSQVKARAIERITGVSLNRNVLSSPEKIKKAISDADRYRSQVTITEMQSKYAEMERQYADYKSREASTNSAYVANAKQKAIDSGKQNPYDTLVQYSLVQGYFFTRISILGVVLETYTEVPAALCEIERLNELTISKNQIAKIPPEIGKLKNLKMLNLKDNKITVIPEELSQLGNIQKIDISGNQISKLPSGIGMLKSLKSLNIKGNPISPEELSRIKTALPDCKIKF